MSESTTGPTAGPTTGPTTGLTTEDVPDEIVRSIRIAAAAQTVFDVISEPGWFINNGEPTAHEITYEGTTATVVDPELGAFAIDVLALDPPRRAVFAWRAGARGALDGEPVTTIEFTLVPDADGVELTVRESGFATFGDDAAERRRRFEDNTSGWAQELDLAKALAEAA